MDAQALGGARGARTGGIATSSGNRLTLLTGARATYEALVSAIDAANERVWLTVYAVRPDASSAPILAALERAAARGLDVRLVVDAFGSRGLEPQLAALRSRGASARSHRLVRREGARWGRLDARNHKKVAAIDSSVAFVGGVNIGDQFLDWRDLHLRVEGPAARDLERVVLADHRDAGGPTRNDVDPIAAGPWVGGEGGRFDVVTSAVPRAMHELVLGLLDGAKERVRLTTPYFVPDRAMRETLVAAARRGVAVEILTPRRSNWPMANWAGRTFYPMLLEAGVRVAEHHDAMLHTKAIVVDGRVAAMGSPNFDARSFHINGEVLCLLFEPSIVAAIERSIDEDRAGARAVLLSDFGRRSRWDRAVEASAALFSRWL